MPGYAQFLLLCIGFSFSSPLSLFSQETSTLRKDTSKLLRNASNIYSSPFCFSTSEWLVTGGALCLTASAFFVDEAIRNYTLNHQQSSISTILSVGELYGNPFSAGIIGSGLYLVGLATKNESTRVSGRVVLESILVAGLLTQSLKILLGRSRPYQQKGSSDFHGLSWTNDRWSFPSGHSTIAFATSASLSTRMKNPVATSLLFSLALLTNASRIYDDKHWFSDTLFGAIVGSSIGFAIGRLGDETNSRDGSVIEQTMPQPIVVIQLPL